ESDLLEKIRYYLAHPDERTAIAVAGQRRTLSQHLFSHRLRTLLDGIRVDPLPVKYSTTPRWDDIRTLVPNPDVVLDCGANIGQTLETLRDLFPKAKVYCFEPVSAAFAQLQQRCAALNAHAVKKAVGDRDGQAQINLTTSPECHSLLGFQEGNPCAKWTQVVGQEEVDVCTLDTWCEQNGIDPKRVDLLKLDVQGAELQALYGARKLLAAAKLVFIEVTFVPIYKDIPLFHEIDRFLTECGYRRHGVYPSDQPQNWGDALYAKV
ncbi:MAG: FkbM family methyltransferase, partial [Planctomycetes bacterium]|nr:FkbM family methyltransferase [Planctomycetota bacterium]